MMGADGRSRPQQIYLLLLDDQQDETSAELGAKIHHRSPSQVAGSPREFSASMSSRRKRKPPAPCGTEGCVQVVKIAVARPSSSNEASAALT